LSKLDYEIGNHREAIDGFVRLVNLGPASKYPEFAANSLVELFKELKPVEKLMVLLAGLAGQQARGFKNIARVAESEQWNVLNLYCAHRVVALEESGTAANNLGIARSRVGLPSLSYRSYGRAAELGVTVAICNRAAMVGSAPNWGAALETLDEHQGTFDAADPGFPFQLRAKFERDVNKEEDKEAEILEKAKRQFQAIWTLASQAFDQRDTVHTTMNGRLEGQIIAIMIQDGKLIADWAVEVIECQFFGGNLFCVRGEEEAAVVLRQSGAMQGVYFSDFSEAAGQEWLTWTPGLSAIESSH
jgi:hypothetical protein